jgi:5'(3')-deoxyribonucleotidase
MNISHIFIDIDGVLADFISKAFTAHGSRYDEATYPKLEWSIANVLGITEGFFWDQIDDAAPNFWPKLALYPWAKELLAEASGIAPVLLLSTPSKHPSCHYGKRQWVDKHAHEFELILCKSKHFLAAPGRVLIDDNDGNIAKWREAGGIGILFPQPWNKNHPFIGDKLGHALEQLHIVADAQSAERPSREWIALCGYARAGKDEAAKALVADGYERRCFGDIIKSQLDELMLTHIGISAFTDEDDEKRQIRGVLEHWGDANYDRITNEFFAKLPPRTVNTRLVRVREAQEWKARGGCIVEIERPGFGPASQWEHDNLAELRASGLIDHTLQNDASIEQLHDTIRRLATVDEPTDLAELEAA